MTAETRVALIRALQALADAIRDERHSRMSGEYSDGEMWRVDEAIDYLAAQYDGNISKSSAQNGGAGECIPDYDHEAGKDGRCIWCDQPMRAEAEANRLRELWDKHGKADLLERAERAENALIHAAENEAAWIERAEQAEAVADSNFEAFHQEQEERKRAEATVDALDKDVASYISDLVDERALADRLAEAMRQSWPGISGESYERPISEVHAAVTDALAAYAEARQPIATVTSTGDAE